MASEVEALRSLGHQVTVWAAGRAAVDADPGVHFLGGSMLFDHPGAWPRLQAAPHRALGLLSASARILWHRHRTRTQKIDRVIAHWLFPSAIPWALLATSSGVPWEIVVHGTDLRLAMHLPSWILSPILRRLSKGNTQLRFVSEALRDELLSKNLPPNIARFIETSRVAPSPITLPPVPSRADARRQLRLDPTGTFAVVVGRLIEGKRIDTALQAAALVPRLKTIVIGSGPLEISLRERFPEARFLGQLDRSKSLLWIAAADLLISASRLEGAPTAVREAIQLRTSVVAVKSGDLAQWSATAQGLYVVD